MLGLGLPVRYDDRPFLRVGQDHEMLIEDVLVSHDMRSVDRRQYGALRRIE